MSDIATPRAAVELPVRARFRISRKQLLLAVLGLSIAAGGASLGRYWWTTGRFIETTDDSYVGGNVTAMAPHVPGFVSRILVTDNQRVTAGQLLITLDDRDYRAKVAHADAVVRRQQATLDNLRAQREWQQSMISQAEADLAAARAQAVFTHQDAARYHQLVASNVASVQADQKSLADDQHAQAMVAAREAGLAAAKQKLAVLDTQAAETRADLAQAEADLDTARLNLGYTEIRSPIDGYIGDRGAQVGAYVTTGTILLSIVPAHGLWVDANFKEDQLAHMHAGQSATVVADMLPGHLFHGRVISLAPATGSVFAVIPPENATGNFTKIVQRVPVRIAIDDGDAALGRLRPGLSVSASIDTRDTTAVEQAAEQVK